MISPKHIHAASHKEELQRKSDVGAGEKHLCFTVTLVREAACTVKIFTSSEEEAWNQVIDHLLTGFLNEEDIGDVIYGDPYISSIKQEVD